ncbi:MAG: tetratricopeptide repeat protein [Planctomycetota bacterium]|jgi:tetratricopeptide (TPR) repeat protein
MTKLATYRAEIKSSEESADSASTEDRPFARGSFVTNLKAMQAQLDRDEAEIFFLRGRSYAALQLNEKALEDYREASKLAPQNAIYAGAVAIWEKRIEADD